MPHNQRQTDLNRNAKVTNIADLPTLPKLSIQQKLECSYHGWEGNLK